MPRGQKLCLFPQPGQLKLQWSRGPTNLVSPHGIKGRTRQLYGFLFGSDAVPGSMQQRLPDLTCQKRTVRGLDWRYLGRPDGREVRCQRHSRGLRSFNCGGGGVVIAIGTELERAWWRSLPEVPYVAVVKLFGRELQPGRCRCGNAWLLLESPAADSRTDGGVVVEVVVPPWSEGNLIVVVVVAGGMFHCSMGLFLVGGRWRRDLNS